MEYDTKRIELDNIYKQFILILFEMIYQAIVNLVHCWTTSEFCACSKAIEVIDNDNENITQLQVNKCLEEIK